MIKTKHDYEHARATLLLNKGMNDLDQRNIENAEVEIHEAKNRISNRNVQSEIIQGNIDALPMNKRKDFE